MKQSTLSLWGHDRTYIKLGFKGSMIIIRYQAKNHIIFCERVFECWDVFSSENESIVGNDEYGVDALKLILKQFFISFDDHV